MAAMVPRPSRREGGAGTLTDMAASAANWDRGLRGSRPTRSDDTVVITSGKRATKAEVLALIAADVAERDAEQHRDG